MGFLLRWVFALLLVGLTYNPTPWNYVRWTAANWETQTSLAALFGLILLVGWIIYLRATIRSIGPFGMALIVALVGAILWVAYDFGLLSLSNPGVNTWIGVFAASLVLGVGLSWSIVRRKLTGQADMDDVDE